MSHAPSSEYLPAQKVYARYAVARGTLRLWAQAGKIEALRVGENGKRLYKLADIERVLGVDAAKAQAKRVRVCYARVSSEHQRADLDRQVAFLKQHYPEHELYSDVGSGLNFKRLRFVALLDAVHAGTVAEVVVTDKDRLCRFGSELLQWLFDKADTKLVVHSDGVAADAGEPDRHHELADDILSIVTFFTARSNGQRSARNRKRRRDDAEAAAGQEAAPRKKAKHEAAGGADAESASLSDA
jgi:predicted site-specific integrase-resolvase